jgi:hypothetical protein
MRHQLVAAMPHMYVPSATGGIVRVKQAGMEALSCSVCPYNMMLLYQFCDQGTLALMPLCFRIKKSWLQVMHRFPEPGAGATVRASTQKRGCGHYTEIHACRGGNADCK